MKEIVLSRVDSRLIHGQVITLCFKHYRFNEILLVSNKINNDMFLKEMYKLILPIGVTIEIVGSQEVEKWWKNNQMKSGKLLILTDTLLNIQLLVKLKIIQDKVQIGGLIGGKNKKIYYKSLFLSNIDIEIIQYLKAQNIELFYQRVPSEKAIKI
ncbi:MULTISPECIES: PTS sugar transporter subunit IIB [Aerococcus]|uniref:PTS sugar transporter subunit IIB n=1 Tax=Aerococcus TaxID=1375 RepID=UPI000DCE90E5|nr:PTS sugar transporter subunit IIB [Aerococcus urinae]RAV93825.1 hypothetical protein DBT53_08265 [Aerococcus mictus]MDK6375284.1 PTS sugar transporter subunit IIB [Aerococcus urinae]MDK6420132.1 PTS sugar transporter subunit IIB [Aerococcus urinae]MDK8075625.1 PTS sugar transporter subunit IIB [Aerococcus urinae]MDK8084606.1 PTS sugar transporter subunit IIB [Aerococcus urinae]